MTDEQRTEHIRVVSCAIGVLNKQIVNLMYSQARMIESTIFLMTRNDDFIRNNRKNFDDDFFVAQQIIETDKIK